MNARPQLYGLVAGLFLAAGLVCSAMVFTRAWLRIAEAHVITVTGSARRTVASDLIIWSGTFSAEAEKLLDAQHKLKEDRGKVEAFLIQKGLTNYTVSAIEIQELTTDKPPEKHPSQKTVGYRLSQTVTIQSPEVDRITRFTTESAALVDQGVLFVSNQPQYIYTKAGETKVEMLAEATRDARSRAEQIAEQGGRHVAGLRSARMGVFQITPLYSGETSGEGQNDLTSPQKTITAVVTATFSMR